ncbi:MAG: ATP-binding cassette domain-containing protein, partial [Kiloniellaceae bacterium]
MHDVIREEALSQSAPAPSMAPGGIWPVAFDDVRFAAGGKTLIDGLSLELAPGSRSVIMGPNGAGKSLTLRLIAGLIRPGAGSITYGGKAADAALLRRIAV